MDLDLKGRVAFVTGGGAGIGEAIAVALADEGCTGRASPIATGPLPSAPPRRSRVTDTPLTQSPSTSATTVPFEAAFAAIGKIGAPDILVNAAGLLSIGAVADLPAGEFDRVARGQCRRHHQLREGGALPAMAAARRGRIVNIASISAMRGGGSVGNTLYGATKAAVVALTMGLARELGPSGITVNAVAPAIVDTAMTHAALTDESAAKHLGAHSARPLRHDRRRRRPGDISRLRPRRLHHRNGHSGRRRHSDDVTSRLVSRRFFDAGRSRRRQHDGAGRDDVVDATRRATDR